MHRWKQRLGQALVVAELATGFGGCATSTMNVVAPPQLAQGAAYPTVKIERAPERVPVASEGRSHFDNRLKEFLYAKDGGFAPGDALTIRYRFLKFDEGDQLARWMAPTLAGQGMLKVEAVFLDNQQRELAKIVAEGELSMGPFGGDFDGAISKAARELADYAIKTF